MKITGSCIITGTFTSAERGLRVAEEQSSLYGVKRNAWPSRIKSWESDSGGEWQSSIIKAVDNRASSLLNTCARWRSIVERGMEKVEDLSRRSLIRHRDIVIWEKNGWDEKRKKKKTHLQRCRDDGRTLTRAAVIENESLARDELNRGDARGFIGACRFLEPVASCNGK